MGILAWFVHGFITDNQLTPNYILVLFITAVLASVWAVFTLFSYHRSSSNSRFVSFVDFAFIGALIAGVYQLRFISNADCVHVSTSDPWVVSAGGLVTLSGVGIDVSTNKPCTMLKTCFAFGIMNTVFFFFTGCLAWMHARHLRSSEGDRRYVRETTTVHRRRRSGSHGGDYRGSSRPRSGSHQSRHSSHSHQRVYV